MVSAEIGGHWVARVEALVPPVYSSDAATSSTTTHTHHLPHPPETHRPTPKHASHTHSCTIVCLLKKPFRIYWNFSFDSRSPPRCGSQEWPKVRLWRIGQKFCGSKLSPSLSSLIMWEGGEVRVPPFTAMQTSTKDNRPNFL